MYSFKKVSKSDFDNTTNCVLLQHDQANEYWLLSIQNIKYGFAINPGIMIDPILVNFEQNEIIFAGIHDFVVAFSAIDGSIQFLSGLQDPFTEVIKIKLGYLVVTDTTFLKINEYNFSVARLIQIPDVIVDYQISDDKIIVQGVTGEIFKLPYP